MKKEYQMFIQDHDGHWYKIFVKDRDSFDEWLELCEKPSCQVEDGDYDGPDFDKFRCMHPCNYMATDIVVLSERKAK